MATRSLGAALFLGLLGGVAGAGAASAGGDARTSESSISTANILTPEEKEAGWKLLFNGTDLSGWRSPEGAFQASGWIVDDTALARRGNGPAAIFSTEAFGDFELTLDWKVGRGDDAGVFIRVADGNAAPGTMSPEVQLIDNRWNSLAMEPKRSAGACLELYAPAKDATLPVGQYNTLRVVAMGGRIEHWINGERVVEYVIGSEDWNSRLARSAFKDRPAFAASPLGYLAIQQDDPTVRIRNVKIRPLEASSLAAAPRRTVGTAVGIAPLPWPRNLLGRAVTVRDRVPTFFPAGVP